ncbi:MAG TPA: chromate transporter [Xanthobacteraceae bacterium]|jgi:chromate transporter|nr:chromate transporter [Xanthobacteraceae bacterium]
MSSPPAPAATVPDPQPQSSSPPAVQPTLGEIFIAFATISLSGFGGVLAWSRRMMVDERKWLTPEQFNETYALCSFLPGGNILNFSVVFGARFRGALGSLVAFAGLLGPPMLLVMAIGAVYAHYGDLPALGRALTGVAAAAAGLMLATVAKMAKPLFANRAVIRPLFAIVTFICIGVIHWPLPLVLIVILPLAIAYAWVRP